jgi:hypothetical protein
MRIIRSVLIILILIVSITGCSPRDYVNHFNYIRQVSYDEWEQKVIPIGIDNRYGEMDKLAIAGAIEQWNYAFNGRVELRVVKWNNDITIGNDIITSGGFLIMEVESTDTMAIQHNKDYPAINGNINLAWANKIGGNTIYLIRDLVHNEDVKYVMMHEVGHILGADHKGEYLMNMIYHRGKCQCIDYATIKQVAKYQHIGVKEMNYCQYSND